MVLDRGGAQRVGVPAVIARGSHCVRAPLSVQPVRRMVHSPSGTSQVSVPSGASFAVRSITLAGSIGVSPGMGFNSASGAIAQSAESAFAGGSPADILALLMAINRCCAGSCRPGLSGGVWKRLNVDVPVAFEHRRLRQLFGELLRTLDRDFRLHDIFLQASSAVDPRPAGVPAAAPHQAYAQPEPVGLADGMAEQLPPRGTHEWPARRHRALEAARL